MIQILDRTPLMADVVSGIVPRPRERRARENAFRWLVDVTPAWRHLLAEIGRDGDADRWPTVQHRPDLAPARYLGLGDLTHTYLIVWEAPPTTHVKLLCLNADGTRYALLDAPDALSEAWRRLDRLSESQSERARGKSGPKPKPLDELSPSQQWRRRKAKAEEK